LVSELKQTAIFSGFASLNENVDRQIEAFDQEAEKTEKLLEKIGEDPTAGLKELESHYYSSVARNFMHE
jgi:mediator of RNA polymerase II transcription subunit 22